MERAIKKIPTNIQGLDEILNGGLPAKRTSLVIGSPGSGKTVLGVELLYRGALKGKPGIFLGFEESAETIRENAATMGWDIAALEKENKLFIMQGQIEPGAVINGEFSIKPLLAIISGKAKEIGAKVVVLDALDVLLRIYPDHQRVRSELHTLSNWFHNEGLSALITLKPSKSAPRIMFQDFFYSMSDFVLSLDARVNQQVTTRRLRVVKYRGSGFERNECPYVISANGIRIIPISTVLLRHKAFGSRVSSGVPRLDVLLGGGYYRGSCILLAGEPGTGKTILASSFTQEACGNNDKVFYLSFEESREAISANVLNIGIDLEKFHQSGMLKFLASLPEAMGVEEHLHLVISEVEQFNPHHFILDALSAVERFGGQEAAFDYMIRLLNFLKERGTTFLITNQTTGDKSKIEISGSGISSMIDSVIFINYKQEEGELNRTIQVLKSRGSAHSNQIREFIISDNGLHIVDVYIGPAGVATGTVRKTQESRDAIARRLKENELKIKKAELAQLRAQAAAEKSRQQAEIIAAEAALTALQLESEINQQTRQDLVEMRGGDLSSRRSRKKTTKRSTGKKRSKK